MSRFAVARLDDIDEIDDGRCPFRPVRHHFGITSFGVNAMTGHSDGDRLINEHEEAEPDSSEELYVVISGHARFELDGESLEAPAGTFVHVPAGIKRTAFAREAGTTVLAIGRGAAGRPYEPKGWELLAPYGAVYYNTACFESRAGRTDAALAHLRRAVELSPSLAEAARADDDLAALREHAGFAEIVGD